MPQESEIVLRNSLDAVDRSSRHTIAAIAVLFVIIVVTLGSLMGAAVSGVTDRTALAGQTKVLFTTALAQMLFITVCTIVVAGYITRMTKTLLRAIEVMSKEPPK